MEDFLGKLIFGIIAWFVALFVVELIKETIKVVYLTIEEIRRQINSRTELVGKGISHVVISDFIKSAECTTVTLDALKANGERVGKIKMQGQVATVQKGMKIAV